MTLSLLLHHSKHLALQIHMIELGLRTHADDPVAYKHAADPRF